MLKGCYSKRSDDGKSDRGSEAGDREGTVASNTTSLLKKYGATEKACIGKGATAVVRLAHKWDKTSEKLYAVKVCLQSGMSIADGPVGIQKTSQE